jgi:transcriptional regulator with XRE-family HTH domain
MPPQPRPHLTPQQQEAVRLQASGVTQKEVARRVGVSVRTVESWQTKKLYKECLNSLSGQIGLATAPKSVPKSVAVEVLDPQDPQDVDVFEITKDYEHLSDFEVGRQVLRAIALNPESREAARIQASIALIRSVEIGHDLPRHIREGKEESSLQAEREKLKGLSPEELAKEYKRIMSIEYQLEQLKKKTPEEVVALDRLKTREREKLESMNAEELAREYKRILDESGER